MDFELDFFYSKLVSGRLREALEYLRKFPEQSARYDRYVSRFEKNEQNDISGDVILDDVLRLYHGYYRDVFYLGADAQSAADKLRQALAVRFGSGSLDELEQGAVKRTFEEKGYRFLGGKTGGYYGPYIWKDTLDARYEVELPESCETYQLRFLDGFISKSWLDYLSFGEVSTGGWADGDGLISCVKSSYDTSSEDFLVSLLKHEAQHEADLRRYPGISSGELEYRAKLVELIYSSTRQLLPRFALEADASEGADGHGAAAQRIVAAIPAELSTEQIRCRARRLFEESCDEMKAKYSPIGK